MPLYEYQCLKCGQVHEVIQKFSDAPLKDCPSCGGEVSKLMSLSSFALKGSGWYTTDYKRSSGSGGKAGNGGSKNDGGASSEGSSQNSSKAQDSNGSSSSSDSSAKSSSAATSGAKTTVTA